MTHGQILQDLAGCLINLMNSMPEHFVNFVDSFGAIFERSLGFVLLVEVNFHSSLAFNLHLILLEVFTLRLLTIILFHL